MSLQPIKPSSFPYFDYKRYSFSLGVRKGDYIFTSGHSASEFDASLKRMVCKGGPAEQARTVHEKIKLILKAGGVDFGDVVKIVDYVTPTAVSSEHEIDRVRREYFGGQMPAHTRVHVEELVRPDALIEMECIACATTNNLEAVAGHPLRPYPLAVKKGNLVFVSGLTIFDTPSTGTPSRGDLPAQAKDIYGILSGVLEKLGAGLDDVVKVNEHLQSPDPQHYQELASVRRQSFPGSPPAVTQTVDRRLSQPEALVEVECIAVVGGGEKKVIEKEWRGYSDAGSSPAVKKNDLLFMSAALPVDYASGATVVGQGDIAVQLRKVFSNTREVLEATGGSFGDVVKTVDHLVPDGLANYRTTGEVRREIFRDRFPSSSGVVVKGLAVQDALIQVDCTAIVG